MNDTDDICALYPGRTPLLVSLPHVGTLIPADQQHRYVPRALEAEDTDWHLDQLYAFVRGLGAGMLVPRHSRYLIDLNRPAGDSPMYPGANNTELCPTRFFTGEPLYRDGLAPDAAEVDRRRAMYWQPYHRALTAELARLKSRHGHAVLFDAHSIRSVLPWLFEGRLPDLNLGTVDGNSCAPSLRQRLADVLAGQAAFTHVLDGRFKGGWITRSQGRPADGVHAVQLEMTWRCYMDEDAPHGVHPDRARQVVPVLEALVRAMCDWTPDA